MRRWGFWRWIIVILVALVVIGTIGNALGAGRGASPTPGAAEVTATATASSSPTAAPTPTVRPTPTPLVTPTPAPRPLLDLKGSGIQRSAKFTTAGDWTITWSYDCSKYPGGTGVFQIYVKGDTLDVAANELGKSGSGTQPEYTGAGTFYLEMNSVCAWHVVVND
jgi:hypothetical protein